MSCDDDNVCGTGIGDILPKPGDPNNGSALSAVSVFGGINVSWAYPSVNPHAVAYTKLYRGLSNDFANAAELPVVTGSIFFDKIDPVVKTTYYYWIRIVSVNGTIGEIIGPASADAVPIGEETLKRLTGRIDAGYLAQSLKTKLDDIILLHQNLDQEILDRLAHNTALQAALAAVQSNNGQTATYVLNEITERKTADEALVDALNVIAAGMGDNAAAIVEERHVRVTADEAFAQQITTLFTTTGQNTAAIIQEATTRTTNEQSTAQVIQQLVSTTNQNSSAIQTEIITRTNAIDLLASSTQFLIAEFGQNAASNLAAAISTEATARANADSAIATLITEAESRVNGNVAGVQTTLETKITTTNGKVTAIGALWSAKVTVNGLIGGFGVYNDGRTVEAGFDVDTFWVGRTNSDKVKPFIISGGIVYMDIARIRDADITTLKIAGNAVTIPVTSYGGGATGSGNWQVINQVSLTLDQPGIIYAHCLASQFYGSGERTWLMKIAIDGGEGMTIGGLSVTVAPAVSMSRFVGSGTHTITVSWSGSDAGVRITQSEMFAMGAKK